jgi:hypothetical protein
VFLAELNGLETWATDIGTNAYLEVETLESCFIVAGPEFGEREGHTLVILLQGTVRPQDFWSTLARTLR